MDRPLTALELDLLRGLSRGEMQKAIARKRGRSLKTVKNELTRIYRKLGAINAGHAIALAFREGLLH